MAGASLWVDISSTVTGKTIDVHLIEGLEWGLFSLGYLTSVPMTLLLGLNRIMYFYKND